LLHVTVQESGDVAVLLCEGEIVLGDELSTLFNTVVFQRDKKFIVLDLTKIIQIDARGLGALVLLKTWIESANVKLQIIPSKHVREMFELTGLADLLNIPAFKRRQSGSHLHLNRPQETANGPSNGDALSPLNYLDSR
jgi:anti-anti-sigma factor